MGVLGGVDNSKFVNNFEDEKQSELVGDQSQELRNVLDSASSSNARGLTRIFFQNHQRS